MAVMTPEDLDNYKHTLSEELFYNRLKEQLSEKYHCFYSLKWLDEENGKKIESECDFLVYDPGFGFLTIEVKGGDRISIENGEWILHYHDREGNPCTRSLGKGPFSQAENSMRYFKKQYEVEYTDSFAGTYGYAVCFPFFKLEEKVEAAAEKEIVIDVSDQDNLAKRINEIFHYWQSQSGRRVSFPHDQKEKFIRMVNKCISLSAAAGALIPIKERELKKINIIQDSIIDFLTNYNQVQIIGGAGTGKTFMAMKKLRRESYGQRKVLYVCKNRELAEYVSKKMADINGCTSSDYMSLMYKIFGNETEDAQKCFDKLYEVKHPEFDAICVDEAQDFSAEEALVIRGLLHDDSNSVLYVFLDENQNIFNVNFSSAFAIDTPPYVLKYNIRNTGEIYRYAVNNTGMGQETVANNLKGVQPELTVCKSRIQVINTISQILNRLILKQCVSCDSIVLLSDKPYEGTCLPSDMQIGMYRITTDMGDKEKNTIKFRTIAQFKGLEADIIIFLKSSGYSDIAPKEREKEDYVAYTRARYYLYIIEQKDSVNNG